MIRQLVTVGLLPMASIASGRADETNFASPPQVEARIAWMFSSPLDLVGNVDVELPLRSSEATTVEAVVRTETVIARASGLTFEVRQLDYDLELRATLDRAHRWSLRLGQRGLERVDADGQPYVRYLGLALTAPQTGWWERQRLTGGIGAAWIFDDRELRAALRLFGDFSWSNSAQRPRGWALDGRVDLLAGAGSTTLDWSFGPRYRLPWGERGNVGLFARWVHGGTPIGLRSSGLQTGLVFAGLAGRGRSNAPASEFRGALGVGGGDDGRRLARVALIVIAPPIFGDLQATIGLDANVLTARDTGDLFYFLTVGARKPLRGGAAVLQLYHRSDHQLAERGTVRSFNALEIGAQTAGWESALGTMRPVEAALFGGLLLDSDFGEDRRASLRGGLRLTAPRAWSRLHPYVAVDTEISDAGRYELACGLQHERGFDLRLARRRDSQWFSRDRSVWAVTASRHF